MYHVADEVVSPPLDSRIGTFRAQEACKETMKQQEIE